MYEKFGLMVKVSNPDVIAYLRQHQEQSNTLLIENALREKLGIPPKVYSNALRGRKKNSPDCANRIPVKISDKDLIEHILRQKKNYGICQRHTVESAVLSTIGKMR